MTESDHTVLRWRTPPLVEAGQDDAARLTEAQREELEQLRMAARDEGLQAGREEAMQACRAEIEERLGHLGQLLRSLTRPYEDLNQDVAGELAKLAGKIARQLVRRELKISPDAIMGVVRETIACLPEGRDHIKVYLNHQDADLLRDMSQSIGQDGSWEIISDPAIERGDCLVTDGPSLVDANLESRVNTIVAALLGGDREKDAEQ